MCCCDGACVLEQAICGRAADDTCSSGSRRWRDLTALVLGRPLHLGLLTSDAQRGDSPWEGVSICRNLQRDSRLSGPEGFSGCTVE
jgi:hypothetical protein